MNTSTPSFNLGRHRHASFHSTPSRSSAEVIDLTVSTPPPPAQPSTIPYDAPWFHPPPHVVIDVDSLPDPPLPPPLPPPRRRIPTHPPNRRATYLPSEDITRGHEVITLGDDPPSQSRGFPSLFGLIRTQFLGGSPAPRSQEVTHFHYHIHHQDFNQFVPPHNLNYSLNAQHIYGEDTPLRDHPRFKDEAYQAPPPPRDGFTRSPKEDMALICPQCGDELGCDTDVAKKEVWVAKCGHTYCGGCATRQRQNKGKGVKAGRCVVDGCTKIISGDKGMMEIFL